MSANQIKKFIETARQKGVTCGRFQELSATGLLADLLEVSDPATIDRQAFRKFLGLVPIDMVVTVNFDLTLQEMVVQAAFDWIEDRFGSIVDVDQYPIRGTGKKKYRFKLFAPKKMMSSRAAIALMAKDGYRAAGHEAGLAFARAFPNAQRLLRIALLGSPPPKEYGRVHVVLYLDDDYRGRGLNESNFCNGWDTTFGFLGMKEIPST